ncbi:MAG: hypothetical protein ACP5JG_06340, partial [Anaerolineae bacterium]
MTKKRYAQVGLGGRSRMYTQGVVGTYADDAEMVGLCDINEGRLNLAMEAARAWGGNPKGYPSHKFE